MEEAPRPIEVNTRLAPQQRILIDNNLQSGLGCVPGKTKSETIELLDVNSSVVPAGRGCVPG